MTAVAVRPSTFLQRFAGAFKAARRAAVLAYGVPTWMEGQPPMYSDRNFERYVSEGYQKNELMYACITANAATAALVSLKVYDQTEHEEIKDHPLRRLMARPSPFLSEYDFWALTSIYEDLAGVAYWEKVRNGAGEVVELFPLRPDYMTAIPSSTTFISTYLYAVPGMDEKRIAPADVLVFKQFDPRDLRQAISPTKVAARSIDVDNSLTDYIRLLEEKGFEPPGVLTTKLVLQDSDVDEILRRLRTRYGGIENRNKPLVLDRDATYQRTGSTMQEMDFTAQDERNEARICEIYQIPPIIVGARVGLRYGTYANYQEARLSWWEDKLTPKYKHRSDVIDAQLAPDFDKTVDTEFDTSKVPALMEKKQAERRARASEFSTGLITRNMFYKFIGEAQLPPETGDVFVQSIAVTSVPLNGLPEPPPPPAPMTPPPTEEPPPNEPPAEPPNDVTTAAEERDKETVPASAKSAPVEPPAEPNVAPPVCPVPPPEPDPAVIAAAVAPYTPDGQLKALTDVLDQRTAAQDAAAAVLPEPPKDCYVLLSLADDTTITAIQEPLRAAYPGIDWIEPSSFHLTLVYAKEVTDLKPIRNVLPRQIQPFDLTVAGLRTFPTPNAKQPVVLTVVPSPELTALQSNLFTSFKTLGLTLSEFSDPAQWQPHVTLGYMPAGLPLPAYEGTATLQAQTLACNIATDADTFETIYTVKSRVPAADNPAAVAEQIAPYTPDGQLKALAATLDKRTDAAKEPELPIEKPATLPVEDKAKAPLPFDDLLKVTDEDVKRWETMYQKLVEKVGDGKPTGA